MSARPETPQAQAALHSRPQTAKVPSIQSPLSNTTSVPAYVIQDPSYSAHAVSPSARPASSPIMHTSVPSHTAGNAGKRLRPVPRHARATHDPDTTPMSPEDSFIKQDDSIFPEASSALTYPSPAYGQTEEPSNATSDRIPHSAATRPRTAATPISFPANETYEGPQSNSGGYSGAEVVLDFPRRPTTAAPARSRHFSPSPRRVLSAHNGRQSTRRPTTSTRTPKGEAAAATCIELSVRRVDRTAPAAMPLRKERSTPSPLRARKTYTPPVRGDPTPPRPGHCSSAASPRRACDCSASPQRQIHSAPARGRDWGVGAGAASDLAAARVETHAIASDGSDEGLLPSYTLQFALGMVDRAAGAPMVAYSTRACSACVPMPCAHSCRCDMCMFETCLGAFACHKVLV